MYLAKFLHTESGKIIMSMIIGFGLATIFRYSCKGRNCIILKAPSFDEINDKVYKYNGKCYKYDHYSTQCEKDMEIVEM